MKDYHSKNGMNLQDITFIFVARLLAEKVFMNISKLQKQLKVSIQMLNLKVIGGF